MGQPPPSLRRPPTRQHQDAEAGQRGSSGVDGSHHLAFFFVLRSFG
jgi:hypothetical protein